MAFESGVLSFSMFYLQRRMPDDAAERFAAHALPPVETVSREPVHGWVTGRHLLDSRITEDTARVAGRLRLTLVKAERKIPEALLRAECKMEELAILEADGRDFVDRKTRSQIRKEVTERLLPKMPPTLTGIPIVYEPGSDVLYAGATTDKQIDVLVLSFAQAAGVDLAPLTPQSAALKRKHRSLVDLPPTSFSPRVEDDAAGTSVGMDFLTWLWFFFEERGGTLTVDGETCGVMIEGPLTFFMEGAGAHLATLRNGEPLVASEAKAALLVGKKLSRARLVLTRREETWTATFDAETFVLRGMKLPKGQAVGPVGRFEERMLSLGRFREALLLLYDRFLDERTDPAQWAETRTAIHRWVDERVTGG